MRKKSLLPIDEVNKLNAYLDSIKVGVNEEQDIMDEILDLLILAYVYGTESANYDLDITSKPNVDQMNKSIDKPIADKVWSQRVKEYFESGDTESIKRVIETETHRVYNEAQFNTAINSGIDAKKTWVTMLDEKVRDTHSFLEGVTVGINEKFNTVDGDSAMAPGGFGSAENNVNCRCELKLSR